MTFLRASRQLLNQSTPSTAPPSEGTEERARLQAAAKVSRGPGLRGRTEGRRDGGGSAGPRRGFGDDAEARGPVDSAAAYRAPFYMWRRRSVQPVSSTLPGGFCAAEVFLFFTPRGSFQRREEGEKSAGWTCRSSTVAGCWDCCWGSSEHRHNLAQAVSTALFSTWASLRLPFTSLTHLGAQSVLFFFLLSKRQAESFSFFFLPPHIISC